MKNLSNCLALALLLAPTAAQADQWCNADGQHRWTYASGQAPYTFQCDDVETPSVTQASQYAYNKCQLAWDNFASNVVTVIDSAGFQSSIYSVPVSGMPGFCRWKYRCRACRTGFPILEARPEVLGPAVVGGIATDLVAGKVQSIVLHGAGGDRPYYLVDVLAKSEQVQVEVDAQSGHAEVIKEEEGGGICRQ